MDDDAMARTVEGGEALRTVLKNLEAQSNRFAAALTGAFARAVTGGKGLDEILQATAARLIDISLSAGLKPLQGVLSTALETASGASPGSALAARFSGGGRPAGGVRAALPFSSAGGIAAPAFLAADAGGAHKAGEAAAAAGTGAGGTGGVAGVVPNVVFNVTARDAESFRKSEGQIAAMLTRTVGRGRRGV